MSTVGDGRGHHSVLDRLPDEIMCIILSNLDVVNLCIIMVTCKRFFTLVPKIRSLSTLLPFSFLDSLDSLKWYTRRNQNDDDEDLDYYHAYRLCFDGSPLLEGPEICHVEDLIRTLKTEKHYDFGNDILTPRFFGKFTSLNFLEATLEIPDSRKCYLTLGNPWFSWDAELYGTAKPKGYIALTFGRPEDGKEQYGTFENELRLYNALYDIMFHFLAARILFSNVGSDVIQSVVTKDSRFNGRFRLYCGDDNGGFEGETSEEWLLDKRRMRLKVCFLESPLSVKNNTIELRNACFMFLSWVKDDDTTDIDDLIKTSLGFGSKQEGDDERKELREAAMEILAHKDALKYVGLRS